MCAQGDFIFEDFSTLVWTRLVDWLGVMPYHVSSHVAPVFGLLFAQLAIVILVDLAILIITILGGKEVIDRCFV
jgi:hypothetical protein